MQIEFVLLILSILFFASILAGKAGSRFGVPALQTPWSSSVVLPWSFQLSRKRRQCVLSFP